MNRKVQQLVQEVSHTLLRENLESGSSLLISDAEKIQIKNKVAALFEAQDLPLDSEHLHQVTNKLVAIKNTQIHSFNQKNSNYLPAKKVRWLDTSRFKQMSEEQQKNESFTFILNHRPQSSQESAHIIDLLSRTKRNCFSNNLRLSIGYLGFLGMFAGLTGSFALGELGSCILFIISAIVPLLSLTHAHTKNFMFSEDSKKILHESNVHTLKSVDVKKANNLALDLMGIPKSLFSKKSYAMYAQHMNEKPSNSFNFLSIVDFKDEKVLTFIDKSGIEKTPKVKQTFEYWRSTGKPIRHMELMALGLIATHLCH